MIFLRKFFQKPTEEKLIEEVPIEKKPTKEKEFSIYRFTEEELNRYTQDIQESQDIFKIVELAQEHYYKGHEELCRERQPKYALPSYSKAIGLIPEFYKNAIFERGCCNKKTGEWQKAINDFNLIFLLNPESDWVYAFIGECHMNLKEFDKAKEYFDLAINVEVSKEKVKKLLIEMKQKMKDE